MALARRGIQLPGQRIDCAHEAGTRWVAPTRSPPARMSGMLDHVSIQCADIAASASFYDAVLAPYVTPVAVPVRMNTDTRQSNKDASFSRSVTTGCGTP